MKTREQKYQAILARAMLLDAKGKTETFLEVARFLNRSGFRTNAGQPYAEHPRGIAKVIALAYEHAVAKFGKNKALPICNAFTRKSGEYAWDE